MLFTTITSVLTIFFLILTTTLIANGLGAEEFGAYSLARRILSLIEPISTACIAFSLTRYTAMSKEENLGKEYLMSGTVLVFALCSLITLLGLIFQDQLTKFIFNSIEYKDLFRSTLYIIFSYSIYILIYSYYRGLGRMQLANLWQIILVGLGPFLIAFQFSEYGNASLIMVLVASLLSLAIFPLITELSFSGLVKVFSKKNKEIKELLNYGMPRVPGIFAYNALFFIGPFLSSFIGNLKGSGYLMIGQLILRIIEGGMEAFSRVAFPKIAELYKKFGKKEIANKVIDFVEMIIHLGLFFSFQIFIWSEIIIFFWLGKEYQEAVKYIQIFSIGTLPYLAFICLRNIIDAIEVKAIITQYLFFALLVTIIISLSGMYAADPIFIFAIAFVAGVYVMGSLVFWKICSDFSISIHKLNIFKSLLYNLVFIITATMLIPVFSQSQNSFIFFASFLSLQALFFSMYIFMLFFSGAAWILRIYDRLIQQ
jgi:O-antigen/teichoic acid export membrane protein